MGHDRTSSPAPKDASTAASLVRGARSPTDHFVPGRSWACMPSIQRTTSPGVESSRAPMRWDARRSAVRRRRPGVDEAAGIAPVSTRAALSSRARSGPATAQRPPWPASARGVDRREAGAPVRVPRSGRHALGRLGRALRRLDGGTPDGPPEGPPHRPHRGSRRYFCQGGRADRAAPAGPNQAARGRWPCRLRTGRRRCARRRAGRHPRPRRDEEGIDGGLVMAGTCSGCSGAIRPLARLGPAPGRPRRPRPAARGSRHAGPSPRPSAGPPGSARRPRRHHPRTMPRRSGGGPWSGPHRACCSRRGRRRSRSRR